MRDMILKTLLAAWNVLVFIYSVSGTSLTVCPSQINGTACLLICDTTDFSQTVTFRKDGLSAGACLSTGLCGTSISGYIGPYRIGTTQTVLNITSYNITRDIGIWTCSLGSSASPPLTMHYAIPPTSATIAATNFTVNSTTQLTVTTECAYINISGILQLEGTIYSQSKICTELPSSGCASGTGEKYMCTFTLKPSDVNGGTHLLRFRVDLPYDDTNPEVSLTTQVYVTFPYSLPTTVSTTSTPLSNITTEIQIPPECNNNCIAIITGSLAGVIVLIIIIICCVKHRKQLVQM